MIKKLLILPVLLSTLNASPSENCAGQADNSGNNWSYCIYKTTGSSPDVIYHFTALGEAVTSWSDKQNGAFYSEIRDQWQTLKLKYETGSGSIGKIKLTSDFPTVVTVTVEDGVTGLYLYNERNSTDASGRLTYFVGTLLQTIEKQLGFAPQKRHLLGGSQGAFNAIQVASMLKTPPTSAVLVCPLITTLSPQATHTDIENYQKRNNASKDQIEFLLLGLKDNFLTDKEWLERSPLTLISQSLFSSTRVYLSPNLDDDYGFFEGAYLFAQAARLNGVNVRLSPREGKHCENLDGKAVATFIFSVATKHEKP